jgi:DNA-binding transcriptional regulator GbsR (MarR family)
MNTTDPSPLASPAPSSALSPVAWRFIEHWGEMGSNWGVNRTVAQIHALLYLAGRPLHAEEIGETLNVARSNVSNSIKELQQWNLVRALRLVGDRREHFETSRDVWELFRTVVRERKAREFDPTIEVLRQCVGDTAFRREEAGAQLRIKETLALMEALSAWGDEMLRLEPETLTKIMKLGARIRKLLRDGAKG